MNNIEFVATLVCTGRHRMSNGKLGVRLQQLDSEWNMVGNEMVYDLSKGTSKFKAGAVYEVKAERDSEGKTFSLFSNTAVYKGAWGDTKEAAVWQARSEAEEIAHKMKKRHDKEMKGSPQLRELLKPIRQEYHATDKLGRLAIEALVLNAIRSYDPSL